PEELGVLRRLAVGGADVEGHHRHAGLAAPRRVLGDLLRGDGEVGRLRAGRLGAHPRRGADGRTRAHRFPPRLSSGTTQVPVPRQTTRGFGSTSGGEGDTSGRGEIPFRASKRIFRLVRPTSMISPSASMKSPANTGARNSTES